MLEEAIRQSRGQDAVMRCAPPLGEATVQGGDDDHHVVVDDDDGGGGGGDDDGGGFIIIPGGDDLVEKLEAFVPSLSLRG